MNLRCRPGDLCVIVDDEFPENLGKFLTVVKSAEAIEGKPAWQCFSPSILRAWNAFGTASELTEPNELVDWTDDALRPLRDPGDDATDEILRIAGKPAITEFLKAAKEAV